MTIKGSKPVPEKIRRVIARLVQLHHDTHPDRLAAITGFSPAYCRILWHQTQHEELPHVITALCLLEDMKRESWESA